MFKCTICCLFVVVDDKQSKLSQAFFLSGLQDAIARNLLVSDDTVISTRVLTINASTGTIVNSAWWQRKGFEVQGPRKLNEPALEVGEKPDPQYPW